MNTSSAVNLKHRFLLRQLIVRELAQRHRGSLLGALWLWLTPLVLLMLYTFVFSSILQLRWPGQTRVHWGDYAITLFAGLVPFGFFSDVLQKAPTVIVSNPNYVKKVVFPLHLLPVVHVASAFIQMAIGLVILIVWVTIINRGVPVKAVALPLAIAPLVFLVLGIGWLASSLGVFLRDTAPAVAILGQILFFASPVFYAVEMIPSNIRWLMNLNPLACILESFRRILIWDRWPEWAPLLGWSAGLFLFMSICYSFFVRTREHFADVL